ncbi:G5 domain-containing protein, partial [Globicatella sanguinis]|uniref:G5 domain-containing protein n=1 Tax=Globicatella sanguinis TaxID=13076 RepID=UPI0012EDE8EA
MERKNRYALRKTNNGLVSCIVGVFLLISISNTKIINVAAENIDDVVSDSLIVNNVPVDSEVETISEDDNEIKEVTVIEDIGDPEEEVETNIPTSLDEVQDIALSVSFSNENLSSEEIIIEDNSDNYTFSENLEPKTSEIVGENDNNIFENSLESSDIIQKNTEDSELEISSGTFLNRANIPTQDIYAPKFVSLVTDKLYYSTGEPINITVNVREESETVTDVSLTLAGSKIRLPYGGTDFITLKPQNITKNNDSVISINFTLDTSNIIDTTAFSPYWLTLQDEWGNQLILDYSNINYTEFGVVSQIGEEFSVPEILEIKSSQSAYKSGETITYMIKAKEDSNIKNGKIRLTNPSGIGKAELSQDKIARISTDSEGYYRIEFDFPTNDKTPSSRYYLTEVNLEDEWGNYVTASMDNSFANIPYVEVPIDIMYEPEERISTREEIIPFETIIIEDSELREGVRALIQTGQNGSISQTISQTVFGSEMLVEPHVVSEEYKEPVNEIIKVGTGILTSETVTEEIEIPFDQIIYQVPDLPIDIRNIVRQGEKGLEEVTYTQYYLNGRIYGDREFHNRIILKPTIDEIVEIGTMPPKEDVLNLISISPEKELYQSGEPIKIISLIESSTEISEMNIKLFSDSNNNPRYTRFYYIPKLTNITDNLNGTYTLEHTIDLPPNISETMYTFEEVKIENTNKNLYLNFGDEIINRDFIVLPNGDNKQPPTTAVLPEIIDVKFDKYYYKPGEEVKLEFLINDNSTINNIYAQVSRRWDESKMWTSQNNKGFTVKQNQDGTQSIILNFVLPVDAVETEYSLTEYVVNNEWNYGAYASFINGLTPVKFEVLNNLIEKVEKEIEIIPYRTKYIQNSELPSGYISILQNGLDGKIEYTTKTLYQGSKMIEGPFRSKEVVSNTFDEIIEIGTGKITYLKEIVNEQIPFEIEYIESAELLVGEEIVYKNGVNGESVTTISKSMINDIQFGDTTVSKEVVKLPISQIVYVGTGVVVDKVETTTKAIPFKTERIETADLPEGEEKVQTVGVNGEQKITTTTPMLNSKPYGEATVSKEITKAPVNQVVLVGTGKIEQVVTTSTKPIPFTTEFVENPDLVKGEVKVIQV